MTIKKNLHWFVCILFALSCARQSSPTGGPKDTIPPKLISTVPQHEAINFKGTQIELQFSEMVIANNPKEQLIITPSVGKDYEFKVRKNSVVIELEKPLEENTTYTFNFRESVQDINEKNPAKNLQLAVSSGPYVDSLSITGSVSDHIKASLLKDITVAIYPEENDTFNVLKHPASYFTKTDEKGNFKIDHLKPARYFIYTFDDKNRNLIIDSKNEAYGFKKSGINLLADTANVSLTTVKLDARPLKLMSARPYNTYFNIRTSKSIKNFTITASDSSDVFYSFGEDPSNIRIYNTQNIQDSLAVRFTANDSIGNTIDSTLYVKFPPRDATPEKFGMTVVSKSIVGDKGRLEAKLSFSKPLKEVNFDSIFFRVDSLTEINLASDDLAYDEPNRVLTITKTMNKSLFKVPEQPIAKSKTDTAQQKVIKRLNQLYFGKAAFMSAENDSSAQLVETITPLKTEDLSMIIFSIKTTRPNTIIQLLDKDFKVIRETLNIQKGQFEDLLAGDYQFRVIIDLNKNGKWDPGNILEKEEPEPIFYSLDDKKSQVIKLKANWEIVLPVLLITY